MAADPARRLTAREVLAAIPHAPPFHFVDEILELDDDHIVAACSFDEGADFYRGHFPGNPITPGVLLLEAMAQAGVVAHGIYLVGRAADEMLTLFTQANAEFLGVVRPGERLLVHGRKLKFRHRMLRSQVRMTRENGEVVCEATLTGVGVKKTSGVIFADAAATPSAAGMKKTSEVNFAGRAATPSEAVPSAAASSAAAPSACDEKSTPEVIFTDGASAKNVCDPFPGAAR